MCALLRSVRIRAEFYFGFSFTVDAPVGGKREKDLRSKGVYQDSSLKDNDSVSGGQLLKYGEKSAAENVFSSILFYGRSVASLHGLQS